MFDLICNKKPEVVRAVTFLLSGCKYRHPYSASDISGFLSLMRKTVILVIRSGANSTW